MRADTRAILTEAPGSQSFQMQDIPAIAEAARRRGVCVIKDNTWATPLFFPPHERGVDIAIGAGTRYLSGHSDLLVGLISANAQWRPRLHACIDNYAIPRPPRIACSRCAGLRTMELHLKEAERQALAMAHWLEARPEVKRVLHLALSSHPGDEIWKRNFLGSSGLFSIVLHPATEEAVAAMLDGLELFGMGYSWGGYESLVIPSYRPATPWAPGWPTLRLQIGLEDIEDL